MNQEQNNFNQNDFNTPGNNGIPNNQDLNNTFSQNIGVNQTQFDSQQQVNTNYQQATNQMNIQQPTNLFEDGNTNQNFNVKPPKKKNIGLIIGIVLGCCTIIVALIILLGGNKSKNIDSNKENESSKIEESDKVDKNYIAEWNDFTVYVQGVEFSFPMTFSEFENKISKTSYKIEDESSKDKKIYGTNFSTSNYITYTNMVREYNYSTKKHELAYDIKVYLQNMNDESTVAKDCMVVGFEIKDIVWMSSDETDSPHDSNIYFTKGKLYLGQEITKAQLEKKYGKSNESSSSSNIYSAGSFSSAFYNFPKFQCSIKDNKISYLSIINVIEEDS